MHKPSYSNEKNWIQYVVFDELRNTLCVQPINKHGVSVGIRSTLNHRNMFYGKDNKRFKLIGKI